MAGTDLLSLLKRVVEIAMPNLRAYYRVVRKAKVVATHASDGRYWADVQPLRNDESVDSAEPVIPHVEIPVLWGGPKRGVVCPPAVGTLCDLEYYDGDPDFPRISNFRWQGNSAPDCEIGAWIVQQTPGTSIKIDAGGNVITLTPANNINECGGDLTNTVGGSKQEAVGGNWTIEVSGPATIKAPQINLVGNLSATGQDGGVGKETKSAHTTHQGSYTINGPIKCTSLEVSGSANISGNCYAGSRSGGLL